jgi:hypothetical protein
MVGTNQPVPGVFICADGDPSWSHVDAWWSAQSTIAEAVFLAFACYQSYFYFNRGLGGIVYLLRSDSIVYFLMCVLLTVLRYITLCN